MKKVSLFIVLILSALAFTACRQGGPSNKIDVVMTDFHYTPDAFTIPAGQEITINATNNGAVVHQFAIMKYGTKITENFEDKDRQNVYWMIELQPGDQTSTTFTAPSQPGEYQIVCGTPGHFISGMVGKLTVVAQ